MKRFLGICCNPDYLAPGMTVAYIYRGKLHVGVTETGLNAGEGKFTVRNFVTGKIEYPYTQEVFLSETKVTELESQITEKEIL